MPYNGSFDKSYPYLLPEEEVVVEALQDYRSSEDIDERYYVPVRTLYEKYEEFYDSHDIDISYGEKLKKQMFGVALNRLFPEAIVTSRRCPDTGGRIRVRAKMRGPGEKLSPCYGGETGAYLLRLREDKSDE